MRYLIFIIIFSYSILPSIGQQIKLDGIDVRQIIVNDTLTVNQYLDILNSESTRYQIKSKTIFKNRKYLKPKVESNEQYYPNGKIKFKVDYRWRGGDSSRVFYKYDSLERLVEAINYNSIYGKDDEGSLINIEYDELGRVVKCKTKYRVTSFGYNSNGSKEWVEFLDYEYRYSNRKKNKSYLAGSRVNKYFYRYTPFGKLSCIVNSRGDTLVQFNYNKLNQLIEKNSFNIWSERFRYESGRIKEKDFIDHNNHEEDSSISETCKYFYNDDQLIKTDCRVFEGYGENSVYEYKYNEKGLLSEVLRKKPNGKILKHTIYNYEFY